MERIKQWAQANEFSTRGFFDRDPRLVAPDLLGKLLVHGGTSGWIRETEAYLATGDPAAHAFRGRTNRTRILYGPPGHAYVYRTRQHCCLNVAVQGVGVPGCVLIRALVPVSGVDTMRRRRGGVPDARLADGPAKLCQAMAIDMRHYGDGPDRRCAAAHRRRTLRRRASRPHRASASPRLRIGRCATSW